MLITNNLTRIYSLLESLKTLFIPWIIGKTSIQILLPKLITRIKISLRVLINHLIARLLWQNKCCLTQWTNQISQDKLTIVIVTKTKIIWLISIIHKEITVLWEINLKFKIILQKLKDSTNLR